jgi:hypothetical protein
MLANDKEVDVTVFSLAFPDGISEDEVTTLDGAHNIDASATDGPSADF